jgi:hypothetical protein
LSLSVWVLSIAQARSDLLLLIKSFCQKISAPVFQSLKREWLFGYFPQRQSISMDSSSAFQSLKREMPSCHFTGRDEFILTASSFQSLKREWLFGYQKPPSTYAPYFSILQSLKRDPLSDHSCSIAASHNG